MKSIISTDKSFSTWAKQTCALHKDILEHMRQSRDPLERVIAVRILKNGDYQANIP